MIIKALFSSILFLSAAYMIFGYPSVKYCFQIGYPVFAWIYIGFAIFHVVLGFLILAHKEAK